jgi:hypothetical protein
MIIDFDFACYMLLPNGGGFTSAQKLMGYGMNWRPKACVQTTSLMWSNASLKPRMGRIKLT